MVETLAWVALMGSATACGLSVLSFGLVLSGRRWTRIVARSTARREITGYWRALDRDLVELHGRVDGLSTPRKPTIAIARTAPEPRLDLDDAA